MLKPLLSHIRAVLRYLTYPKSHLVIKSEKEALQLKLCLSRWKRIQHIDW